MAKTDVFITFDYDHDLDLKNLLVGQSNIPDSPFNIADWSVRVASSGWREDAMRRIRRADQVAVICGHHTNTATGVSAELAMAQEEGKPYFLLAGSAHGTNQKPKAAKSSDKMYNWTWDNLKKLVAGGR